MPQKIAYYDIFPLSALLDQKYCKRRELFNGRTSQETVIAFEEVLLDGTQKDFYFSLYGTDCVHLY